MCSSHRLESRNRWQILDQPILFDDIYVLMDDESEDNIVSESPVKNEGGVSHRSRY